MFKDAKALAAPAAPKKGKHKLELAVAGVEQLAMVDALQKALEGVREALEGGVKGFVGDKMREIYCATGVKPESIRAVEGIGAASVELRKKGGNIALNEQQVATLRSAGLEPEETVVVPQLYGINPAHAGNDELLARVSEALKGIVPDDFIVVQEKKVKYTVSESVVAKVFAMKDKAAPELVQVITTMACKPTLKEVNVGSILDFVRGLLVAKGEPAGSRFEVLDVPAKQAP